MSPPERRPAEAARRTIPVVAASDCGASEPFALMVLGDAMLPEFAEGDVIVVEPGGLVEDGSFVVAAVGDEWTLRRLVRDGQGWCLRALDPSLPAVAIADLAPVRGVVIQKARPGRRRATRRYVD